MRNLCIICFKAQIEGNGSFYGVPIDEAKRLRWCRAIRMNLSKGEYVCEDHFQSSDIIRRVKKNSLMPNAVPFLPSPLREKRMAIGPTFKRTYLDKLPSAVNRLIVAQHAMQSDGSGSGPCSMNLRIKSVQSLNLSLQATPPQKTVTTLQQPRIKKAVSQTDSITLETTMQMQIDALNAEVKELKAENQNLKRKLSCAEAVVASLKTSG